MRSKPSTQRESSTWVPSRGGGAVLEGLTQKLTGRRSATDRALADFFRKMETMLSSGLRVDQALRSAMPGGFGLLGRSLQRVLERVKRGGELGEAMRAAGGFPTLTVELVSAGEAAGALAEVSGFLADHYERQIRYRRRLMMQLAWPVIQLTLSVLILTALIFVLGMIARFTGNEPVDVLGFGLTGTAGALTFLGGVVGLIVGGWLAYRLAVRTFGRHGAVHRLLLVLPIVRPVMLNLAMARFCWALHLTTESAAPIGEALGMSLRATDNPAFSVLVEPVQQGIDEGNEVGETLAATGMFPDEFVRHVDVAESAGTLSETLERLSREYWDRSDRALSTFFWAITIAVWLAVGALIVTAIFRLFFVLYYNPIQDALHMVE